MYSKIKINNIFSLVILVVSFITLHVNGVRPPTGPGIYNGPEYLWGINGGYYPGWSNEKGNGLCGRAGITSSRMLFPLSFFKRWGYNILYDNNSIQSARLNGQSNFTAFLMMRQDEDYSLPTSLYEPIWLPTNDTIVNPNNEWASFIYNVSTTYKNEVKFYEVWNEPDYVNDWRYNENWWTNPPNATELARFGGGIYQYIRMLRITYEVAKFVDPTVFITVGGLGYPSFLDAVLRYTDNANDTTKTGKDYIDAMSSHYYPYLATSQTNSDSYVNNYIKHINAFKNVMNNRGWSPKYWIVTETGVSTRPFGNYYGSESLQRNYFLKLPTFSILNKVVQNHIFVLGDTTNSWFGLFYNFINQANANMKPSAKSLTIWKQFMSNRTLNIASSSNLQSKLPNGAIGYVYQSIANSSNVVYLLWANSTNYQYDEQTPSIKVNLTSIGDFYLYQYDGSYNVAHRNNGTGRVTFNIQATPIFVYDSFTSLPDPPSDGGGASSSPSVLSNLNHLFILSIVLLLLLVTL